MKGKVLMLENLFYYAPFKVGSHHYADFFLKREYRLGWITNPISLLHWLRIKRFQWNFIQFREWIKGGVWLSKNLFHYSPLTLIPFKNSLCLRGKGVLEHTIKLTAPPIKKILDKNGFQDVDILWITNPIYGCLIPEIPHRIAVFRLADALWGFNDVPFLMEYKVRDVLRRVDFVFVTSRPLLRLVKQLREDNVFYLPNGVDYEHIAHWKGREDPLNYIPKPRAIYVGAVKDWLDVDLIKFAAEELRTVHFVIIGPIETDVKPLLKLSNVHFLGPRSYSSLPSYLHNADVGIIPFRKSELTDSINPIKLWEYMAAGLPVVSVGLEEIRSFDLPVYLTSTEYEFTEAILEALSKGKNLDLQKIAEENSWERRFKFVSDILNLAFEI